MKLANSITMMNKTCITALGLILVITCNAFAGAGSRLVNVSARVVPQLKYQTLHTETVIAITEANIAKGYVDINRGMVLSISTNSQAGYLLWISVNNKLLREVTIYTHNNVYRLMQSGSEIHMPYEGKKDIAKELSFRLYLSSEAKPGIYEWPLSIMLTAI